VGFIEEDAAMNLECLSKHLAFEEGRKPHAYQDHKGYWTIGIGHLIDARRGGKFPDHIRKAIADYARQNAEDLLIHGLPDQIIDQLHEHDLEGAITDLDNNVSWWGDLPDNVQDALAAMCFQLGWPSLSGFKKMWAALKARDYDTAAREALDSKWGKVDTPARAGRVAMMIKGVEQ